MKRGLIVSCQALPGEPLHSSMIMGRMALAAEEGGAIGIRANSTEDIRAIQEAVKLPIIGIIKKNYEGIEPYITPTLKEVEDLVSTGIEVIALDATFQQSEAFLKEVRLKFPNQKLMADVSTANEGIRAASLGYDYIGTTLVGYTEQSKDVSNFEVLKTLIETCDKPVIAEGNFDTPEKAAEALKLGAYAVVVGSAITRPQYITKRFAEVCKVDSE